MRDHRVHGRWSAVAAVALSATVVGLLGSSSAGALSTGCSQTGLIVTCTYMSGTNAFVVPNGVSSVHLVAVGGSGGSGAGNSNLGTSGGAGGAGSHVEGDLSVTPGDTLFAVVGGNGVPGIGETSGGGGANGGANGNDCNVHGEATGGGGGASDVRTSPTDVSSRVLVAAGAGGGGCGHEGDGGYGGAAGQAGGPGGGASGNTVDLSNGGGGGGAGQPNAGGAGGVGGAAANAGDEVGCTGADGALHDGGFGSFDFAPGGCEGGGGGGGGGFYGGGGGGGPSFSGSTRGGAGGGGGGSNLVPAGGSASIDATGTPEIVISYTAPDTVNPASLDFGNQPLGSTSTSKTVTLSDTGSASIAVSSVAISGTNAGDFATSSDTCSGKTIAASGSCTAQVTFAPTATGVRVATLNFNDDAYDSPQTVTLTGTGTTLGDVSVAISGPSSARSGSQDTYAMTISNAGPSKALNVVMTAQVPNGTKFVGVSTTQGTCTQPASGATSGTIRCSLGDLASGGAAVDSLALKITLNAKGGSIAVAANASSSVTPDPNLANNVASLSTTVSKK